MSSPQLWASHDPVAIRPPAAGAHLTTSEWNLILEALSVYRHHTLYRELYEKLAPPQTRS